MTDFLQTALTFPTLIWSVLFALCAVYWLVAATGLIGHHHGDHGLTDPHFHAGEVHHSHGAPDATDAGLLTRLGLNGVPLTVVLTLLSFCAWVITYFVHLLLLSSLPAAGRDLLGLLVAVGALIPALPLTNVLVRPLRPVFRSLNTPDHQPVVGRVGVVTTSHVDGRYGQAAVQDGGAGLLLQVRCTPPERPVRGDRVVLLEYNAADHSYWVTTEDRFNA